MSAFLLLKAVNAQHQEISGHNPLGGGYPGSCATCRAISAARLAICPDDLPTAEKNLADPDGGA